VAGSIDPAGFDGRLRALARSDLPIVANYTAGKGAFRAALPLDTGGRVIDGPRPEAARKPPSPQ